VRELRSTVERLAAKAGGRIITTDYVRREIEPEKKAMLEPTVAERFPELREDETFTEHI
jgi:hypothetical protein